MKGYGPTLKGCWAVYLHVGGNEVVALREIITIMDQSCMEKGHGNDAFLQSYRDGGKVFRVGEGPVSSWIVTESMVIASPISTSTLRKRANLGEGTAF